MKVDSYIERAYKTACEHGFHDKSLDNEHYLMLVICEVTEFVEADRKNKRSNLAMFERESITPQSPDHVTEHWKFCFEQFVKNTMEDKLADICIRIFDFMGVNEFKQADLDRCHFAPSDSIPDPFVVQAFYMVRTITECDDLVLLCYCVLRQAEEMAKNVGCDLEKHIELKMKYNRLRPIRHGKKY